MAATGIAFRSTADEPRPMVPLTLTSAEVWRRLPLTSTSTWSGERPRSCAGRTPLVPSAMPGRGKFSEGRARASAVASSVVPVALKASGVMMSIGEDDSATVRSLTRVPVTMMVSRVLAVLSAGADSWAKAGVANRATRMAAANGAGLRIMRTPSAGSGTGLCAGHLPVALQHPGSGGSQVVLRHNITSISSVPTLFEQILCFFPYADAAYAALSS